MTYMYRHLNEHNILLCNIYNIIYCAPNVFDFGSCSLTLRPKLI